MTFTNNPINLKKEHRSDLTVAYAILRQKTHDDCNGLTVAHYQARNGWTTEDKEILRLKASDGWTVAHIQARNGWATEDKEILRLKNTNGYSVANYILIFRINSTPLDEVNFEEVVKAADKVKRLLNREIQEVIGNLAK